jgi:tetratricopeptide (TPR) repeat protein
MNTSLMLHQAIAAARAGRRAEARTTLLQILTHDDQNETAWLWLSGMVDDPADQRECLEQVLALNPANTKARQGIAWLDTQQPQPSPEAPETPVDPPGTTTVVLPPTPPVVPKPPDDAGQAAASFGQPYQPETQESLTALAGQPSSAGRPTIALTLPEPHATAAPDAAPETAEPQPDEQCPYCGAVAPLEHHTCPHCRHSLVMRAAANAKRSRATTILAALWGLSTLGTVLGTVFLAVGAYGMVLMLGQTDSALSNWLVPTIGGLLFAAILFNGSVAYGLWQRRRWAYLVNVGSVTLGWLGFCGLVALSVFMGSAGVYNEITGSSVAFTVMRNFAILFGYTATTFVSYSDFFGPMVRVHTYVPHRDDSGHYNAGLDYQRRGMWHMAVLEWERAVAAAPNDLTYQRALGLGYAQLRRFDEARRMLQTALARHPLQPQLQDDLALVERLATQGR